MVTADMIDCDRFSLIVVYYYQFYRFFPVNVFPLIGQLEYRLVFVSGS